MRALLASSADRGASKRTRIYVIGVQKWFSAVAQAGRCKSGQTIRTRAISLSVEWNRDISYVTMRDSSTKLRFARDDK